MAADACTNYLACQPEPTSTFRAVLPADVAPKVGELAATGSSPYPLVLAAIGVVVIILAVILIWLGRRSK